MSLYTLTIRYLRQKFKDEGIYEQHSFDDAEPMLVEAYTLGMKRGKAIGKVLAQDEMEVDIDESDSV